MTTDADDARSATFPSTCWSQICRGSKEKSAAWEHLAHRYWKPIHRYLRAGLGARGDAGDLTQDFFAWMLDSDFLERVDPERGRFRGFIKVALRNYVRDRHRREKAIKRGGATWTRALSEVAQDDVATLGGEARTPEEELDHAWRSELLQRAIDQLREALVASGRERLFRVFEEYYLAEENTLDYRAVASRHGISRTDVTNYLTRAKKLFRAHLKTLVLETVHHSDDLREELEWLFGQRSA
jgi:RNA polymerase sigma-70 factor (ECF subfamily)